MIETRLLEYQSPVSHRALLLGKALAVVYTPANEHFGIVPIEAMYSRCPVIACCRYTPHVRTGVLHRETVHAYRKTVHACPSRPCTCAARSSPAAGTPPTTVQGYYIERLFTRIERLITRIERLFTRIERLFTRAHRGHVLALPGHRLLQVHPPSFICKHLLSTSLVSFKITARLL